MIMNIKSELKRKMVNEKLDNIERSYAKRLKLRGKML